MSKQLVRVGIQKIKDLYLRIVAPRNLFIEFMHEVRSATRLPIERTGEVFQFVKDLKGPRLNGGVQIEYRVYCCIQP